MDGVFSVVCEVGVLASGMCCRRYSLGKWEVKKDIDAIYHQDLKIAFLLVYLTVRIL